MEQLSNKNPRIEVVDALRGFAVMAILLVHSLEHFIFPVYPTDSPTWLNILDQGVLSGVFTLFAGKSYAIFALLFGFTFYIQSNNPTDIKFYTICRDTVYFGKIRSETQQDI